MPKKPTTNRSSIFLNPAQRGFITDAQAALRGDLKGVALTGARHDDGRTFNGDRGTSRSVSAPMRSPAVAATRQTNADTPSRAGQFTDFSGYLGDVGNVFKGYGDVLNPVNAYHGMEHIYQTGRKKGGVAAAKALANGTWHGLTDWTTTDDPRKFGSSFGTTLIALAPGIKRIPNPTNIALEGPWLTPEGGPVNGATLIKVSRGGKQIGRVDIGKLPDEAAIPARLRNRTMPHYHRRVADPSKPGASLKNQGMSRHRPWQDGDGNRW